ncbi:DUF6408 family protein [Streptomyces sp. CS227]|nr:DUF6408 family protein [Streptomyces sp. CS227]
MVPVEYKAALRERVRAILIEVAAGVITNLLVMTLVAVASLLF